VAFGAPGTPGTNGFPVGPGPDGDIVLTLRVWRPQRTPIGDEAGSWTDIGGLTYVVQPQSSSAPGAVCTSFRDGEPDRQADPANMVELTVNVSDCLASRGGAWRVGEELGIAVRATAPASLDASEQVIGFRRVR
jgi:hypothetical protein